MKQQSLSYPRALLIPFKTSPLITVLQLINSLIKLVFAPLTVLAAASFIDCAISAVSGNPDDFAKAMAWLGVLLAVRIYGYVEEPIFSLLNKQKGFKEWLAIDYPAIYSRACIDVKHTENSETTDLINRTSSPAGALHAMLPNMTGAIVFIGQIASYAAIILANAPLAGCIIILSAIPVIFIARKSAGAEYKAKRDITKQERLVWALHDHLSNRDDAAERSMFGFLDFLDGKFRREFTQSRNYVLKTVISWELRKNVSGLMITLLSAVTLFSLLPSVSSGSLTAGLYISLVSTIFTAAQSIAFDLSSHFERLSKDKEFLREYNRYMALSRNPEAADKMADPVSEFKSMELKNVTFTYPDTDVQILKGVSMKIEAGKKYSLIGINGSGKSTIVKLMLRQYDEYGGEILINGKSIRDWKLSEIKAMMGAVFQDFVRYDLSLSDNISAGNGMEAGSGDIDDAIRISGLDDLVSQLPDGKNTLIGKVYENGEDISGGQWQKTAIARAIVSRAQLKILDEPTAALDPMAEREVYKRFEEISCGSATIFISHRLASCVNSDVIYLLDDGRICEQGSHQKLMAQGGKYCDMFESQRGWYA